MYKTAKEWDKGVRMPSEDNIFMKLHIEIFRYILDEDNDGERLINALENNVAISKKYNFFDYGLDTVDFKQTYQRRLLKNMREYMVRDDLIDGGTKRRAFYTYIKSKDYDEFVYVSPRQGYAQLSTYMCRDLGRNQQLQYQRVRGIG